MAVFGRYFSILRLGRQFSLVIEAFTEKALDVAVDAVLK